MKNERHPIAMRIPAGQLKQIDKLAHAHGMSRTEYMIRAALGELNIETRLDTIEQRLSALEEKR